MPDKLFEPIDRTIVDTSRIDPKFVHEFGIGCIVWSYNLGYSTKAYPKPASAPQSWADLFDLKKFPGKRALGDNVVSHAGGRPAGRWRDPGQALPAGRRPGAEQARHHQGANHLLGTNSQSQQLFVDGEVTLGLILNGRAYDASKKGAPIAISWDQSIQSVDYLVVPRGSRNREAAMGLINTMGEAGNQAKLANLIAYSPTNPAAFKAIDPAIEPWLSTAPTNASKGFVIDAAYWRDHQKPLLERWAAWKLS